MIFEIQLTTLEVRFTNFLITVAFPATIFGITTTPDFPTCDLCHTVYLLPISCVEGFQNSTF